MSWLVNQNSRFIKNENNVLTNVNRTPCLDFEGLGDWGSKTHGYKSWDDQFGGWGPYPSRIILLITDAGPIRNDDPYSATGMNEPEIAAQLAQYVYYPSPNRAAEKLLPEEFLQDPVIYPSEQALKNSEVYKKSPPRIQKFKNSIYNSLIH